VTRAFRSLPIKCALHLRLYFCDSILDDSDCWRSSGKAAHPISCRALQMMLGLVDSSHMACCGGGRRSLYNTLTRLTVWLRWLIWKWLTAPCHSGHDSQRYPTESIHIVTPPRCSHSDRLSVSTEIIKQSDSSSVGRWRSSASTVCGWAPGCLSV